MIDFIATPNGTNDRPVKAIQLFVVFDNFGLCDNLHTTVEAVGGNSVTQMRFTGGRVDRDCRARQFVM